MPRDSSFTCPDQVPIHSPDSMTRPHARASSHSGIWRSWPVSMLGQSAQASSSGRMDGVTGVHDMAGR